MSPPERGWEMILDWAGTLATWFVVLATALYLPLAAWLAASRRGQ